MRRKSLWIVLFLTVVLAGCNMPIRAVEPSAEEAAAPAAPEEAATAEPTPEPLPPTDTPEPTATETETPAPTDTPMPVPPQVRAAADEAACYFGPGLEYSIEGALAGEAFVPVLGRDDLSRWVQIAHPTRERVFCWLPIEKVQLEGDLPMAPYVPPPTPFVAYVSVVVSPESKTVSCGSVTFNVEFTFSVTGPTTVEYRRTPPGSAAGSLEKYTFSEAGTKTFSDSFTRSSSGTYTYRVEVSSPNGSTGEGSGTLKCK